MSLTVSARRRRRGTRRTGCRAARRSGSACRTSPPSAPPRSRCRGARSAAAIRSAVAALLLVRQRHQHAGRHRRARRRQRAGAEEQAEHPGHADRDADARGTVVARRRPGCRSGRRSRSSRTARSRAAGSRRPCRCSSRGRGRSSGRPRTGPGRAPPPSRPPGPARPGPRRAAGRVTPERAHRVGERRVRRGDLGQREARALACASVAPAVSTSRLGHLAPGRSCRACRPRAAPPRGRRARARGRSPRRSCGC